MPRNLSKIENIQDIPNIAFLGYIKNGGENKSLSSK